MNDIISLNLIGLRKQKCLHCYTTVLWKKKRSCLHVKWKSGCSWHW